MRLSHAAAAWVFERLNLDGALAGDLQECAAGRSLLWYWRQVLVAIWAGTRDTILDHNVLALRALVTGCAANAGWLSLWHMFLKIGLSVTPRLLLNRSPLC